MPFFVRKWRTGLFTFPQLPSAQNTRPYTLSRGKRHTRGSGSCLNFALFPHMWCLGPGTKATVQETNSNDVEGETGDANVHRQHRFHFGVGPVRWCMCVRVCARACVCVCVFVLVVLVVLGGHSVRDECVVVMSVSVCVLVCGCVVVCA